jgi:tripeptide aminopeptidase
LKIVFNPDEEVGRGVLHLPVGDLGAVAGYTVDGTGRGEIQAETFSAAQVRMKIRGRAIHPGWAKGELVNAVKLAAALVERLPKDRLSPETTAEREGFVHPILIGGDSSAVEVRFIVRDFEDDLLERHVELLRGIVAEVAAGEPRASIDVTVRAQYPNMRSHLERHPDVVAIAERAIRAEGIEPVRTPIRGGTDGSRLSEMGLPTPNIFTGGHEYHSVREWASLQEMAAAAATIVHLAGEWAKQ